MSNLKSSVRLDLHQDCIDSEQTAPGRARPPAPAAAAPPWAPRPRRARRARPTPTVQTTERERGAQSADRPWLRTNPQKHNPQSDRGPREELRAASEGMYTHHVIPRLYQRRGARNTYRTRLHGIDGRARPAAGHPESQTKRGLADNYTGWVQLLGCASA